MKRVILVALLAITIVIISCGDNNDGKLDYSSTIEYKDLIISSQLPGLVEHIYFTEGDLVKENDTLLVINHEKLDLQYAQAIATKNVLLSQFKMLRKGARKEDRILASEQFVQAETNFKIAEKNKKRMEKLYSTESITEKQFDDAILVYEISNSKFKSAKENVNKSKSARPEQIEQIEAKIEQATASVALIEKQINDCYVVSPITGQIVNQFIERGEVVNFLSSLFRVIDLTKAEMVIYISEVDLAFIKLGGNVDISIDVYNDKTFAGTIYYISPEAEFTPKNIQTKDERTKLVFAVKIKIPNPDMILKQGMPADAVIKLKD